VGSLDIAVFLQPSSDLYMRCPSIPAGIFHYNLEFSRVNDRQKDTATKLQYPFVWRGDGPVELDKYFGY
jgi:hypothetical protein